MIPEIESKLQSITRYLIRFQLFVFSIESRCRTPPETHTACRVGPALRIRDAHTHILVLPPVRVLHSTIILQASGPRGARARTAESELTQYLINESSCQRVVYVCVVAMFGGVGSVGWMETEQLCCGVCHSPLHPQQDMDNGSGPWAPCRACLVRSFVVSSEMYAILINVGVGFSGRPDERLSPRLSPVFFSVLRKTFTSEIQLVHRNAHTHTRTQSV